MLIAAAPALADVPYRTVVLQEDPVVGDPPAEYSRFAPPFIDKDGNAIYQATITGGGGNYGLWSESGGMSLEYQSETHPDGTPIGTEFDLLSHVVANKLGQVAVVANLEGPYPLVDSTNDSGIWANTSGSMELIAREDGAAPGGPAGALFDSLSSFTRPVMNASGTMAFMADMKNGPGGVGSSDRRGIWRGTNSGDLTLVVRKNDQVLGGPVGQLHSGFDNPVMNENGDLAFKGYLTGTDTSGSSAVLWAETGGSLDIVARQGDAAPIVGSVGEEYGSFFNYVGINTNGTLVFYNRLTIGVAGVTSDNDETIWTGAPGSFELLAREGSQAPDAPVGAIFSYVSVPQLNALDQVVFRGGLEIGPGGVTADTDSAIWSTVSGSPEMIVREGDPVPGVPGGVFSLLSSPGINDAGQVTFHASMVVGPGGVTSTDATGIWAQLPDGQLALVARIGDSIDVDDGPGVDLRTLTGLNYSGFGTGFGNESGLSHFFNEQGELIFNGHFVGGGGGYGDQGVFVWDSNAVPEPATVSLLTLCGLAMLHKRRKR